MTELSASDWGGSASTGSAPSQPQSSSSLARRYVHISTLFFVACMATHILFLYGQVAPTWKMTLTVEDINLWANSTSITSNLFFDALSLPHHYNYQYAANHTVKEFTYGYDVQELWEAKDTEYPGALLAKMTALGLIVFGGIWPHLMLLLLQRAWCTRTTNPKRRARVLSWLTFLAKWSLVYVFAVSVLLGLLNLEWKLNPYSLKKGIYENLHTLIGWASQVWGVSDICSWAMRKDMTDCNHVSPLDMPKCRRCKSFVSSAFSDPELVETTGKAIVRDMRVGGGGFLGSAGTIRLSVKGMPGIYYFCAACLLLTTLSLLVQWYNYLLVKTLENPEPLLTLEAPNVLEATQPLLQQDDQSQGDPEDATTDVTEPAGNVDDDSTAYFSVRSTITAPQQAHQHPWYQNPYLLPAMTLLLALLAIFEPVLERRVGGGIPDLLQEILGIRWNKTYSLYALQSAVGAAGGWNSMLMATLGWYCVWAPLLRAILAAWLTLTKPKAEHKRIRHFLVRVTNFLAAFCAWEVFLVAVIAVEWIMPTVTDTILNTPACHVIAKDGGSCFKVACVCIPITVLCMVMGLVLKLKDEDEEEEEEDRQPQESESDTL